MEVTKETFKEVLPSIYELIDQADFIAVDAEMTGLRRSDCRYNELDSLEERYIKVRDSGRDFGLIQFGLTTFRYNKEKATYYHATFCFYLHGKDGQVLAFDNSSLRFLAYNGFNFNKLYKSGLPYLSLKEEEDEKASFLKQPLEALAPSPVKVVEEGAKKFLKETEEKVNKFMSPDNNSEVLTISGSTLSGFFRKLLYNNIAAKYENILIRAVPNNSDRSVEIRKFSSQEARTAFLEGERKRKLEEKVGFTHVIRRVLERSCPLVGHNMILDILHLFHKTVRPLPDTLQQFKAEVRSTLPTIYDTKLISKDPPFCTDIPITALEKLYSSLCKNYNPPPLEVEPGAYMSHDIGEGGGGRAHDAGYDAFMTGVSFVTMVKKLDGGNWKEKCVINSKHLALYANKVNLMNSHDIPYINLVGSDVVPNRSRIFCVDCPASWTSSDVYGLFHMLKPVKLIWVSSLSLYVIPLDNLDIKACRQHLKTIIASCPPLVRVRLYGDTAKRKSQSSEDSGSVTGTETASPARIQEYKRLKSVGSDQLSQMTLESPSMEESPAIPVYPGDGGKKLKGNGSQNSGVFNVPDDW
ncbi:hypothetical protein Pmani_002387 [Petrolisthes manimaculis]|uniref:Uncharacterized protein n=1 Tax=Petrolisthes manimaculis TaxID=1843537 RepID=A0AAE1QIQ6_9EUCA|nr:hypothetical protein Pmani_002387 [Petrolisthes manimaculis]